MTELVGNVFASRLLRGSSDLLMGLVAWFVIASAAVLLIQTSPLSSQDRTHVLAAGFIVVVSIVSLTWWILGRRLTVGRVVWVSFVSIVIVASLISEEFLPRSITALKREGEWKDLPIWPVLILTLLVASVPFLPVVLLKPDQLNRPCSKRDILAAGPKHLLYPFLTVAVPLYIYSIEWESLYPVGFLAAALSLSLAGFLMVRLGLWTDSVEPKYRTELMLVHVAGSFLLAFIGILLEPRALTAQDATSLASMGSVLWFATATGALLAMNLRVLRRMRDTHVDLQDRDRPGEPVSFQRC